MGKWKLLTGHPGPIAGWGVPPTQFHGNATSIFDDIELPEKAFIDDVKESVNDCEDGCDDAKPSRRRYFRIPYIFRAKKSNEF